MNPHRVLNLGIVSSILGVVASYVMIMFVPQDFVLYVILFLAARVLIIVLVVLVVAKVVLVLVDHYAGLSPEDQAKVHHYGKRALRVAATRLKRNEKYRGVIEDAETILKSD